MDPLMLFAEALRSKGGVENRAGVLDAERFDLFRGKDLVRWVKANPSKCAAAAAGWLPAAAARCTPPVAARHELLGRCGCREGL